MNLNADDRLCLGALTNFARTNEIELVLMRIGPGMCYGFLDFYQNFKNLFLT